MADHDGEMIDLWESYPRSGHTERPYAQAGSRITTEEFYEGAQSLELLPGGFHNMWVACDAGTRIITARVKAATVGGAVMRAIDPATGTVMGEAASVGTGAWEQITLSFAATKKFYLLKLMNASPPNGDVRVYFDNVEVDY